jgi:hypothetical protein
MIEGFETVLTTRTFLRRYHKSFRKVRSQVNEAQIGLQAAALLTMTDKIWKQA